MRQNKWQFQANNFDLLRLLFATTVCLVHVYQLSEMAELAWIDNLFSSAIAVKAFFIVSGFLIFMSFERSSSLSSYLSKRFRRILPAYSVVILFSAFGLFFISEGSYSQYFSAGWLKYVISNLVFLNFLQPDLPGLFETNRFSAVNGALWTLKIELMFYFSVPFFVYLFRRFTTHCVIAVTYCLSIFYQNGLDWLAVSLSEPLYQMFAKQLPGQLSYFMVGAFLYYHLPFFKTHWKLFFLAAISFFLLKDQFPLFWFEPVALGTIVIIAGLYYPLGNFGKYGDISYGVYIVHFPIIQVYLHLGWFAHRPIALLLSVVLVVAFSGILLWHLVEKRFLMRTSHYRSTASDRL